MAHPTSLQIVGIWLLLTGITFFNSAAFRIFPVPCDYFVHCAGSYYFAFPRSLQQMIRYNFFANVLAFLFTLAGASFVFNFYPRVACIFMVVTQFWAIYSHLYRNDPFYMTVIAIVVAAVTYTHAEMASG